MLSSHAGSSDNLSTTRSIPSTPPATYLYNSQPSTPLVPTLSNLTAQGLNWGAVECDDTPEEFPWSGVASWTPNSPPGQDEMFAIPESSNYTHNHHPQSATIPQLNSANPESPTTLAARHSRKNSGSRKLSARTTLKLHLPPLNQEALVQAAINSNLIPRSRSADDINVERIQTGVAQKLRMGLPANIAKNLGVDFRSNQQLNRARSDGTNVKGGLVSTNPTRSSDPHPGLSGVTSLLTPPDEDRDMTWNGTVSDCGPSQIDAMVHNTVPGPQGQDAEMVVTTATTTTTAMTDMQTTEASRAVDSSKVEENVARGLGQSDFWLGDALRVILSAHDPSFYNNSEAIRIASHALPCPLPSTPSAAVALGSSSEEKSQELPTSASAAPALAAMNGYFLAPVTPSKVENDKVIKGGTTTALHAMTSAIQRVLGDEETTVYMHVSHAVSSNIPLSRLPSGPLTGAGLQSTSFGTGGALYQSMFGNHTSCHNNDGGYFFPSVFHSIVIAHDSTEATNPAANSVNSPHPSTVLPMPMPSPVLPPFSLHYSLLERYIPPPTPSADMAMFNSNTSPLLDRLFELSSHGGSLLFIYPTKTGAKQFCDKYLGQVLDPLLRRLMVLYRLKDDLLWGISRMTAVESMQEFEGLEKRIRSFCKRLSERPPKDSKKSNASKLVIPVSLVHSQKIRVPLNQLSWREWWTQQEQGRIREVVKHHFSKAPEQSSSAATATRDGNSASSPASNMSALATIPQYNGPSDLAREIIDGVKASTTRPSSRGMGEAVFASSMATAGSTCWSVIGDGGPKSRSSEYEGVEVGVFVLRRTA